MKNQWNRVSPSSPRLLVLSWQDILLIASACWRAWGKVKMKPREGWEHFPNTCHLQDTKQNSLPRLAHLLLIECRIKWMLGSIVLIFHWRITELQSLHTLLRITLAVTCRVCLYRLSTLCRCISAFLRFSRKLTPPLLGRRRLNWQWLGNNSYMGMRKTGRIVQGEKFSCDVIAIEASSRSPSSWDQGESHLAQGKM